MPELREIGQVCMGGDLVPSCAKRYAPLERGERDKEKKANGKEGGGVGGSVA